MYQIKGWVLVLFCLGAGFFGPVSKAFELDIKFLAAADVPSSKVTVRPLDQIDSGFVLEKSTDSKARAIYALHVQRPGDGRLSAQWICPNTTVPLYVWAYAYSDFERNDSSITLVKTDSEGEVGTVSTKKQGEKDICKERPDFLIPLSKIANDEGEHWAYLVVVISKYPMVNRPGFIYRINDLEAIGVIGYDATESEKNPSFSDSSEGFNLVKSPCTGLVNSEENPLWLRNTSFQIVSQPQTIKICKVYSDGSFYIKTTTRFEKVQVRKRFTLGSLFDGTLQTGNLYLMEGLIPGDANEDGKINISDFGALKEYFGKTDIPPEVKNCFEDVLVKKDHPCPDFNGDQKVNLADFGILKGNFNKSSLANPPYPDGEGGF